MQNVEKYKYLDEDQHGRHNGRNAVDIALGRSFMFDTIHIQRANVGCTDNNAKACYDQIIQLILLLAYVKAGLPYSTGISSELDRDQLMDRQVGPVSVTWY
eukprot:9632668-Ditylum_brightwellii.AAC.2